MAKRETINVAVSPDYSGDQKALLAIERELRSRGFPVVNADKGSIHAKMADVWRWDMAMYLQELDLVFTDASNGAMRAQAHYSNSAFHKFPSPSRVVERLFRELDSKGVFEK
jgi:hypothetical protein